MTGTPPVTNKERPWVIDSHRGAFKGGLLENSVPAFVESYREGANVVETDLRLTRDDQLVLVHNRTIDHVAQFATRVPDRAEFGEDPTGPVKKHTAAYLQALEFPHDAKILTVPEFLAFLQECRLGAQIELKVGSRRAARLLARQVTDAQLDYARLAGPVVVTSFNLLAVLRFRKAILTDPAVPCYRYPDVPGIAWGGQALKTGAWYGKRLLRWCGRKGFWGFMTHHRYLPATCIPAAHARGLRFCPRVPDDPDLVRAYIAAGVDGFETDNVPFIRQCITDAGYAIPPLPPRP